MFGYLIEILEEYGHGTHGYIKCAERAREAVVNQPESAAAHGLLVSLAEDFIDRNERMAITLADTEAARTQYSKAISLLQKSYNLADTSAILEALNTVAAMRFEAKK